MVRLLFDEGENAFPRGPKPVSLPTGFSFGALFGANIRRFN